MLVSVLLSVRNGAGTIVRAIESVRAQTFPDWELVVVDDGSSDETVSRVLAIDDERIRLMRNATHRGLAASLNIAFRASRGELIARLDADDEALPDRFRKQVDFLLAHPEIDVVGGEAVLVDRDGRELGTAKRPEKHEDIVGPIFRINPFIHPAVMMRRRVLEELGGYDESLPRAQDYDLWLRGAARFRYHNLQEPVIRYTKPERPTWKTTRHTARVLWMNARRQGTPLRGLWFAGRRLAAQTVWALTSWAR
jgi:glycosyltransferase involved in cell wall biosynthesis